MNKRNLFKNRTGGSEDGSDAINMTPLIDMVFILLIFFLVTSSFIRESAVTVERPKASTAQPQPNGELIVTITADDQIWLNGETVDIRLLREQIERLGLANPSRSVIILADTKTSTGLLINLALLLLIGSLISRRQTELVDAMNPQPIDFIRIVRKDEEPKSVEPVVETVVEDEPEPKPAEKPPEPKPAKPSPKKQTNTRPRPVSPRPAKPAARLVPAPKIDVPEHGTGPAFAPVPGSDSRLTAPPSQWDTSKNASESTGGSGSGTGDGGGYSVRRLVVLSRVMPRYPRRARESGIEGWVKLAIVVSPEGKVTEARVVDSEPKRIFDRAALEAIKRWRFKPTYKDGRAVVQRVVQEISFRLDKRR